VGNKLYVGNLAYSMNDQSLQQRFGEFGTVLSAKVMMDRDSGPPRALASSKWARPTRRRQRSAA
jgi:RNA recognition motif-containing protein